MCTRNKVFDPRDVAIVKRLVGLTRAIEIASLDLDINFVEGTLIDRNRIVVFSGLQHLIQEDRRRPEVRIFRPETCNETRKVGRRSLDLRGTLERFGRLDVGVNNAGRTARPPAGSATPIFHEPTSLEAGLDYWNDMLEVGLTSVFLGSRGFARAMAEREIRGSIINVSGHAGMRASVGLAPYGAAKAGVIHLTKTLGAELAPHGIRVNSVAPGATDTRALRGYFSTEERRARAAAAIPMGRIGTPEDIAKVVVLLASDLAGWVTGQTLSADGGQSIAGSGGPNRS